MLQQPHVAVAFLLLLDEFIFLLVHEAGVTVEGFHYFPLPFGLFCYNPMMGIVIKKFIIITIIRKKSGWS